MKLIMENWRKWIHVTEGKRKNFPSDGHTPVDSSTYDTHPGGASSEDDEKTFFQKPSIGDFFRTGKFPSAPVQARKTIHNLSPTAEEILNPETGEIDSVKMRAYIDSATSAWGPEGDPERDEWLDSLKERLKDAVLSLRQKESSPSGLNADENLRLKSVEKAYVEVQGLLRDKGSEVDPLGDTLHSQGSEIDDRDTVPSPPPIPKLKKPDY